jgi:hypothetical protein
MQEREIRYIDRPHRFETDPHSNAGNCRCGMAESWRYHQSLLARWWMSLTGRRNWR